MNNNTKILIRLIKSQLEKAQEVMCENEPKDFKIGYYEATIDSILEDLTEVIKNEGLE